MANEPVNYEEALPLIGEALQIIQASVSGLLFAIYEDERPEPGEYEEDLTRLLHIGYHLALPLGLPRPNGSPFDNE